MSLACGTTTATGAWYKGQLLCCHSVLQLLWRMRPSLPCRFATSDTTGPPGAGGSPVATATAPAQATRSTPHVRLHASLAGPPTARADAGRCVHGSKIVLLTLQLPLLLYKHADAMLRRHVLQCGAPGCQTYAEGCACASCSPGWLLSQAGECTECGVEQCQAYTDGCSCSACNSGWQLASNGSCAVAAVATSNGGSSVGAIAGGVAAGVVVAAAGALARLSQDACCMRCMLP